jgi:hypothetical protein
MVSMHEVGVYSGRYEDLVIQANGTDSSRRFSASRMPANSVMGYGRSACSRAYLLVLRRVVYDVGHQDREQLGHSVNAGSEGSIGRSASRRLACLARRFYPLSSYRVYDIEYAQFVCPRCLFEMRVDFLD